MAFQRTDPAYRLGRQLNRDPEAVQEALRRCGLVLVHYADPTGARPVPRKPAVMLDTTPKPWRCRLGFHGERSQGLVGHCSRRGCDDLKQEAHGPGGWQRYVEPPDAADRPRGLPPR